MRVKCPLKQSVVEGDKSVLNMSASESTQGLDDDDIDIDFKGLGNAQKNNDDTIQLLHLPPPAETCPPEQLLSNDLIMWVLVNSQSFNICMLNKFPCYVFLTLYP